MAAVIILLLAQKAVNYIQYNNQSHIFEFKNSKLTQTANLSSLCGEM